MTLAIVKAVIFTVSLLQVEISYLSNREKFVFVTGVSGCDTANETPATASPHLRDTPHLGSSPCTVCTHRASFNKFPPAIFWKKNEGRFPKNSQSKISISEILQNLYPSPSPSFGYPSKTDGGIYFIDCIDCRQMITYSTIGVYAATVPYNLTEWLDNNKDPLIDIIDEMIKGDASPSCLLWLDDHISSNPDTRFRKFLITGCSFNSKLKVWCSSSWTCLQTIKFQRPQGSVTGIKLKAGLDPTTTFLILSDIDSMLLNDLNIHQNEDRDQMISVGELASPASILSLPCVSVGLRWAKNTTKRVEVSSTAPAMPPVSVKAEPADRFSGNSSPSREVAGILDDCVQLETNEEGNEEEVDGSKEVTTFQGVKPSPKPNNTTLTSIKLPTPPAPPAVVLAPGHEMKDKLESMLDSRLDMMGKTMKARARRDNQAVRQGIDELFVTLFINVNTKTEVTVGTEIKRSLPVLIEKSLDGIHKDMKIFGLENKVVKGLISGAVVKNVSELVDVSLKKAFANQMSGMENSFRVVLNQINDQFLAGNKEYEASLRRKVVTENFEVKDRFNIVAAKAVAKAENDKAASGCVMNMTRLDKKKFRLGDTNVLSRAGILGHMEEVREDKIVSVVAWLQVGARDKAFQTQCRKPQDQKLTGLWCEIQAMAHKRMRNLGDALALVKKFWDELQQVMGNLQDLERALASQEPPAVEPKAIEAQTEKLSDIKGGIDGTKPAVDTRRKFGSALLGGVGDSEKPEPKRHIEDLDSAWDSVTLMYAEREKNLLDAMVKAMEFHDVLQKLLEFLGRSENKFVNLGAIGQDKGEKRQAELEAEETAECSTNTECEKESESSTVKYDTTMAPEEDKEEKNQTAIGPDAEMTTVVEEEAVDNKVEETGAGADSGATTTDSAITESTSEAVAPEDVTNADSETSGDGEQPTDSTVTDDEDTKIVYPMVIDDITTDSPSDSEESTTPAGTDSMTDKDAVTGGATAGPEATRAAEVQCDNVDSDYGETTTSFDDINPLNIPTTTVRTDDMTANILVVEDMPTTKPGRDTIMETTATQDNVASDKSDDTQMETTTSKMMETSSKETEEMTTKMFETNEPNNEENAANDGIQARTEPVIVDETSEATTEPMTSTSTESSVDETTTTSKDEGETIPELPTDAPAEETLEETTTEGGMDNLTTTGPLVADSTEADDADDMTSSGGSTTVSEISTTADSTFDAESTTANQDEDDMKETTTSGKDDEAVDPLEVSTSSGMDVTITDKDMVTDGLTTEPEAATAAGVQYDVKEDDTGQDSVTAPTSDSQERAAISTPDQDTTITSSASQETTTSSADDQESSVTDVISNSETEATTEAVDQSLKGRFDK